MDERPTSPSSAAVRARLELMFDEPQRSQAARMLESVEPHDRLRLAVLKLSAGDLRELSRQIREAQIDWRDVLMAAGFGEDLHAHASWMPPRRARGSPRMHRRH